MTLASRILFLSLALMKLCACSDILMITLGGTKSHKIPFWELAGGLVNRGHNITFLNAFPADFVMPGLEEITPTNLVFFVRNFTNWDLVGARMRNELPVHPLDMIRYGYKSCEETLQDHETNDMLHIHKSFDLIILDGAFPECGLGFVKHYNAPFMYINTVAMYTGSLSLAGNPNPYSITPFLATSFTDNMKLHQRITNAVWYLAGNMLHAVMTKLMIQGILSKKFGYDMPPIYKMSSNVSFILQNSHPAVTYSKAYLPNVAEIACIHCKDPKPLPPELEDFVNGSGDAGFIYFSMGSSVKAFNMPEYFRRMLIRVFRQLPQRVLWKWEGEDMEDLPDNVKLGRWLPQQDLLGHPKIKAFVTHGGLLSMFETVYHGVPIVTLPVFCDHDANSAKSEADGYAIKLDLATINVESLLWAIKRIIHDPKYRIEVLRRQKVFRDQKETPLERAVFWTEYVLRNRGASYLQSPSRFLSASEYYMWDVALLSLLLTFLLYYSFLKPAFYGISRRICSIHSAKEEKVD
ncbi:UDP-glucosyltransferase 2 isoform X2 [Coccinella septempunctata]|nr:UDP-glucosyltransferase 2 isoform X2 [Coccinella septempunctata]